MTDDFRDLTSMQVLGGDRFRVDPAGGPGFLYGGLTMAMAVTAAAATVDEGLVPMSLRCSFVGFGIWGPTDIAVERVSTSRAFAGRRLRVSQQDKLVAAGDVAFHRPETGLDRYYAAPPTIPSPERLEETLAAFGAKEVINPVEMRSPKGSEPSRLERIHPFWARVRQALGDAGAHAAALAFLSDYLVTSSPFEPGTDDGVGLSSHTLQHALWFHRPFAADQWMLFDCVPLTQSAGRFVSRGTVHDERGTLVASFVQEGLLRPSNP